MNSRLLLANKPIQKTIAESVVNTPESYYENLFTLNSDIYKSYIEEKKTRFKTYIENANDIEALNEGIIGSIIEGIKKIIQKIIDFFRNLFGKSNNTNKSDEAEKKVEEHIKNVDKIIEDFKKEGEELKKLDEEQIRKLKRVKDRFKDLIDSTRNLTDSVSDMNTISDIAVAKKEYTIFYLPKQAIDYSIIESVLKDCYNNINNVTAGKNIDDKDPTSETYYKMLANKLSPIRIRTTIDADSIHDATTFKAMVDKDIAYTETKTLTISEYIKECGDNIIASRNALAKTNESNKTKLIDRLEKLKRSVDSIRTTDDERKKQVDIARKYINIINEISLNGWSYIINRINLMYDESYKQFNDTYDKILKAHKELKGITMKYRDKNGEEHITKNFERLMNDAEVDIFDNENLDESVILESSTLYGEPFNGDTLYDNEDLLDFHPSQWLDLQLKTEFAEMHYAYLETVDDIISQEATILTEDYTDKIHRLKVMLEVEKRSFGDKIKMIIENIKKIFTTFFNKLKDKYGANAKFIAKYRKLIEGKPFNFPNSMESKGDVLAGLRRITNDKLDFVPFDYEKMKEDLKDKRVFFEKYIKARLNDNGPHKREPKWDQDTSIADFCKAYFGAAMPEDKYEKCKYFNDDFEKDKIAIIKFLTESNTFLNALRRDMDTLDVRARDVIRSEFNDRSVNTNTSNATVQNNVNNVKNESYYSYLLDRVLYEMEQDKTETGDGKPANNAQDNKNQGNTNDNGDQKENNETPDEEKAFKVYLDAYRDVILSKITAVEFIVIELMQVIKAHAEIYMTRQQKEEERKKQEANNK